jgi:hypothetical protein
LRHVPPGLYRYQSKFGLKLTLRKPNARAVRIMGCLVSARNNWLQAMLRSEHGLLARGKRNPTIAGANRVGAQAP